MSVERPCCYRTILGLCDVGRKIEKDWVGLYRRPKSDFITLRRYRSPQHSGHQQTVESQATNYNSTTPLAEGYNAFVPGYIEICRSTIFGTLAADSLSGNAPIIRLYRTSYDLPAHLNVVLVIFSPAIRMLGE